MLLRRTSLDCARAAGSSRRALARELPRPRPSSILLSLILIGTACGRSTSSESGGSRDASAAGGSDSPAAGGGDAGAPDGRDAGTLDGRDTSVASGDAGLLDPAAVCPAPLQPLAFQACDGVVLTDAAAVKAQTAGITTAAGPGGAAGTRFGAAQSINIVDQGCYQLGRSGSDFTVTMWLKPSGGGRIIGNTSARGPASAFALSAAALPNGELELRAFSRGAPNRSTLEFSSAPFKPNEWIFVALRYRNLGDGSSFDLLVNLNARSGGAFGDVHNDSLQLGDRGNTAPFEVSEPRSFQRALGDLELKALFQQKAAAVGVTAAELGLALDRLEAHIKGSSLLAGAALQAEVDRLVRNSPLFDRDATTLRRVLDLVATYETAVGPLFTTPATRNGVARAAAANDGLDLARAMIAVQQIILDQVYTAPNVAGCRAVLQGRKFATSDYFPGAAPLPQDPTKQYSAVINGTLPAFWGREVAFASEPARRPTGLYVSPGSVAKIVVPAAMVGKGFEVLVGAHTADNTNKATHRRLDRVTRAYPILARTIYVANPLGGGLYINVPYRASLGLQTIQAENVIEAPFFSLKSSDQTSAQEWMRRRATLGPWADFETDKFMMQVPRSWIYAFPDPRPLLEAWDKAMDGVSELLGYPPEKRNKTVLYVQVDLQIRHGAFGIGYPQINNTYDPRTVELGNKNHWLLTDPVKFETEYHELGHAQLFSKFRGETEAAVNFPHAYVRNVKFGVPFDTAFQQSFGPSHGHPGVKPDDAAINWMVTENFRNGREMDYSNSTKNEFRYQHRGYAKYGDVYRVFGWQALRDFFNKEHLDLMAGTPSDGLDPTDSRILRMSIAAKADLTPLIHFWGIFPVNPAALKAKLAQAGIGPSMAVRSQIERYRTIAPANNQDFNDHFERFLPGRPAGGESPDYGAGWYNVWRDVFDTTHAAQIRKTIQDILTLYYGP